MKNAIFLGVLLTILVTSCKKEDDEMDPQACTNTESNYIPMEVGNYWVYQISEVDSLGNETLVDRMDTIRVDRDTVIAGNTFAVIIGTYYLLYSSPKVQQIVRDSLGYLVTPNGSTIFSSSNFSEILFDFVDLAQNGIDTIYSASVQMEIISESITVPAGTFSEIYNRRNKLTSYVNGHSYVRYFDKFYAPNVGVIYESYGFLSPYMPTFRKRLIDYNVQ